jgi:hypothetical protein
MRLSKDQRKLYALMLASHGRMTVNDLIRTVHGKTPGGNVERRFQRDSECTQYCKRCGTGIGFDQQ